MKNNGSITVFFSLFMAVFLLLTEAAFHAVQVQGGRVQAEAGMEEGLYSVFAAYDRELFERYHVFFVDSGYNSQQMQMGNLYQIVENCVQESYAAGNFVTGIQGENIWKSSVNTGAVTGYTLATDQNGQAFASQAAAYMKDTAVIQGIQLLYGQFQQQTRDVEGWEQGTLLERTRNAQETYQNAVDNKDAKQQETDVENQEQPASVQEEKKEEKVQVPDDFVNPLDIIRALRKEGVLGLVLPSGQEISDESFTDRLSERQQASGMGALSCGSGTDSITDQFWFIEYMMQHLECYGESKTSDGVHYQLEYAIAGKDTDRANLESVVKRLLVLREAANLAYIMQDAASQAKVHELALVICASVGLPALESVVSLAIDAAWAFGESVLDVKQLLAGGKVALYKTSGSWLLSLNNLSKISEILKNGVDTQQSGLSYKEYLRLFLMLSKNNQRIERTMDVVEETMRHIEGKDNFYLDQCIGHMEMQIEVNCAGKQYTIKREYGYDM